MFELFDHTADLGLRVRAATLADLLAEAGRGLLAMHVANPESVQAEREKIIELTANDPNFLLFDWLSELLYAFESEKLLLAEFDIAIACGDIGREGDTPAEPLGSAFVLRATCRGELRDDSRHVMDHEVKAITYHGLSVQQGADGNWEAEVIVDI
jgi:SHS2 domain-containing protein